MLDQLFRVFTPQERRIIGAEAKQALENKHWKEAFTEVDAYLDQVALTCDPDNKEKAQRIVISKQLLQSLRNTMVRKIEDGEAAKIEMERIEDNRVRVFRR